MEKKKSKVQKRKKPYVPGLAALHFKPTNSWGRDEAKKAYLKSNFSVPADTISFSDCISGMERMPDQCVDLVIADPPFGIEFHGREALYNRKREYVVEGYKEVNDNYDEFTLAWIKALPRIMKEHASAYIFSGWTHLRHLLDAAQEANLTLINHIIWKYQFGVFTRKKYVTSHYHILFLVKNPKKYYFNKIEHYPLDIWDIPRTYRKGQKKNGTKLPEDVVSRCIDFSSKPGQLIFDPFMGNATTAVSAKANFRHFFGFEANSKLEEIIKHNINQVDIGQHYIPYNERLPSSEDLEKKYPAVKRHLRKKSNC